jgi:hypothetical protein
MKRERRISGIICAVIVLVLAKALPVSSRTITDADWAVLNGDGIPGPKANGCSAIEIYKDKIYVCGDFDAAGKTRAHGIAMWDGIAWHALDSVLTGQVNALACDKEGNLFAGGYFSTVGLDNAGRASRISTLAKWDGSVWHEVGLGHGGVGGYSRVEALAIDSGGNLFVGGGFDTIDHMQFRSIAKWNGRNWDSVGGFQGGVLALCFDKKWNLHAAINTNSYDGVVRWNGKSWESLGPIMASGDGFSEVKSIAFDNDNTLYNGMEHDGIRSGRDFRLPGLKTLFSITGGRSTPPERLQASERSTRIILRGGTAHRGVRAEAERTMKSGFSATTIPRFMFQGILLRREAAFRRIWQKSISRPQVPPLPHARFLPNLRKYSAESGNRFCSFRTSMGPTASVFTRSTAASSAMPSAFQK